MSKRIWKLEGHTVIEARLKSQWRFAPPSDLEWSNFWLVETEDVAKVLAIAESKLTPQRDALEYRVKTE